MLGHPWHVAAASVDGEVWEDEIEGAFLWPSHKKGRAFKYAENYATKNPPETSERHLNFAGKTSWKSCFEIPGVSIATFLLEIYAQFS